MNNSDPNPSGIDDPAQPDTASPPNVETVETVIAERVSSDITTIPPEAFAVISEAEAMTMSLTAPQRTAIEMLTSGHTLVESATAAGVNRTTLHRWLKGDPAFVAAFNAWQRDILATARGRLLALSDVAVSTVARAMQQGDAKTAVALLKSMGVMDRPVPGATDVDEVKLQQQLENRKADIAKRKMVTQLNHEDLTTF